MDNLGQKGESIKRRRKSGKGGSKYGETRDQSKGPDGSGGENREEKGCEETTNT